MQTKMKWKTEQKLRMWQNF